MALVNWILMTGEIIHDPVVWHTIILLANFLYRMGDLNWLQVEAVLKQVINRETESQSTAEPSFHSRALRAGLLEAQASRHESVCGSA